MKTALEFVILCNNRWLKIEVTVRQKSVFARYPPVVCPRGWCVCLRGSGIPALAGSSARCAAREERRNTGLVSVAHPLHSQNVTKFKFPLQPRQKYYITQYEELSVWWLSQMRDDYNTNSHCLTHTFLLERLGECTFSTWEWKGYKVVHATRGKWLELR